MPNHWETSARPLFVKTVFVNGDRHAILFEGDPLLHPPVEKKISRSSSSLSFSSDLSVSCSDSQDSNSESRGSKPRVSSQRQRKDLSTELQSCLVGLKLASGNLGVKNNSNDEKCLCGSKDRKRNQSKEKGNSKQRKHKWSHEKTWKRKQSECKSAERKTSQENGCYVYNLENYKGKKKYCFVKISSQPPEFILNCCCEKNWEVAHICNPSRKDNLVISATIHNLVMPPDGNPLDKPFDYIFPFQNAELYTNNHLTKSYYNSLSDRVFQWLDLARKRKKQKETVPDENPDDFTNTERIFSGKTFVGEIKKTETSKKPDNRPNKTETNEDEEREVTGEPHVETLLSTDKSNHEATKTREPENGSKQQQPANVSILTNPTVPPLKIQDLLLNFHPTEGQNKRKTRSSTHRSKHKDSSREETPRTCEKRGVFVDKFEGICKQSQSHRNLDELQDIIKIPISTEEFEKSINNPNITRARPVLIQNLSPQQPEKISYLQEENIVWASEKNTGRPQLHIFMPSILLTDQTDDNTSECEQIFKFSRLEPVTPGDTEIDTENTSRRQAPSHDDDTGEILQSY